MPNTETSSVYSSAFHLEPKKKGGSKASSPLIPKLAWELVAGNRGRREYVARDAYEVVRGVKPNHTGLVRTERALAGRATRDGVAFCFESVLHGNGAHDLGESGNRSKVITALCAVAQNGVD